MKENRQTNSIIERSRKVMGLKASVFFYRLCLFPALCIITMLLIKWQRLDEQGAYQYIYYLASTLLPAFLSIVILEFGFHKYIQKESKEELEQTIKSMYDKKDPMLVSFNEDRLKGAVRNSLSLLIGDVLADKFVKSVIEELIGKKSYRTNFMYDVTFCNGENGKQEIEQDLKYKKCFKLKDNVELPHTIVSIFTFDNDPFEADLSCDDMVFFCEEIPHSALTEEIIKNKGNHEKILSLLNFKMWLKSKDNQVECVTEIIYSLEDKKPPVGVKISTEIHPDYWCEIDSETSCVWGKLTCRYPSKQNNFYWKFAEPILGNISPIEFNLYFNEVPIDGTKVKQIKYFSGSNDEKEDKNITTKRNRITYKSSSIYFPESGIYFHW